jgi:hypothetical protein
MGRRKTLAGADKSVLFGKLLKNQRASAFVCVQKDPLAAARDKKPDD